MWLNTQEILTLPYFFSFPFDERPVFVILQRPIPASQFWWVIQGSR